MEDGGRCRFVSCRRLLGRPGWNCRLRLQRAAVKVSIVLFISKERKGIEAARGRTMKSHHGRRPGPCGR